MRFVLDGAGVTADKVLAGRGLRAMLGGGCAFWSATLCNICNMDCGAFEVGSFRKMRRNHGFTRMDKRRSAPPQRS